MLLKPFSFFYSLRKLIDALGKLVADKEDTRQVFIILNILGTGAARRSFKRFSKLPQATKIFEAPRELKSYLTDHAYLKSLPDGSFGRRYFEFVRAENITPEGLADASEAGRIDNAWETLDRKRQIFRARQRDAHDLWHVANGYGRDSLGELALLAFTFRQLGNWGLLVIIMTGIIVTRKLFPKVSIWPALREGFKRGRNAAWLPAVIWEDMLARPIDEVRAELKLTQPPQKYRSLRVLFEKMHKTHQSQEAITP